jgi:hypothetical protein
LRDLFSSVKNNLNGLHCLAQIGFCWMSKVYAVLVFLFSVLQAAEFNLSVCAIFKNEAPFLKEWIEYHRLVGVDHFYLYNNGSLDPFRKTLQPYVRQKIVTLVDWPDNLGPMAGEGFSWSLSTQLSAYENALKRTALGNTKWLVFLDIDEFLVTPGAAKLSEILDKYDSAPGIVLSSESYDASHRGHLPAKKLVIESLGITAPLKQNVYRAVQKTILKPELCVSFIWPPYQCNFKGGAEAARVGKRVLRVNRYENRMKFPRIDSIKKSLPFDARVLSDEERDEWLRKGYEIEDPERAAYRCLPDLYQKMGF